MAEELNVEELADLLGEGELLNVAVADEKPQPPVETDNADQKRVKKHKLMKQKESRRRKRTTRRHKDGDDDGGESDYTDDDDDDRSDEASRKRSRYVMDAAESGESDDDSFIADSDEVDEDGGSHVADMSIYEPRKAHIFREGEENMTSEELARAIEERHRAVKQRDKTDAYLSAGLAKGQLSSLRYASHLLPQETDPNVFAVKCRPRMARLLVARIVNKCYSYRIGRNYERRKVDLGIISVFCLDHVKEYIYIEAYRKVFVENALNGLEGLFRYNITLVKPSDLMQMMEQRPSAEKLRPGAFVRLRQRQYRLDLAQVVELDPSGLRVTVRVVPREDFIGKAYNKPETRLPQKHFVANLALHVYDRGDNYRWGDLTFDKEGYLIKVISTRMAITTLQMEKPTVEELAVFFKNDRENVRDACQRLSMNNEPSTFLRIGDTVRVASGQLRETVGKVENIFLDENAVGLSCMVPGRREPIKLRVELLHCVKHFAEGTHVVVSTGEHAGESGTIMKASGDIVYIFSDRATASRELTVRANDCHRSNLVGSFGHKSGAWRLFDLVMLANTSSVACIVRLNRTNISVLTDRNESLYVSSAQIKTAPHNSRQTTDRMSNIITRGTEVNIQSGPNTPLNLVGQTGCVEQLFNTTLFVRVRSVRENAGVVVVDAGSVLLIGGRTTLRQVQKPKQLPVVQRRTHNATKADLPVPNPGMNSEDWNTKSEWYEVE